MSTHEYTAEQALDLLMKKLKEHDVEIATHVQAAIDAGKDVSETEPSNDRRKKPRVYRKTIPFSQEEALQVALDALQAYFVEQPEFVNSAANNFVKPAVGAVITHDEKGQFRSKELERIFPERQGEEEEIEQEIEEEEISLELQGEEKEIEIELQTETQITKSGVETMILKRVSKEQLDEQKRHILELRKLTDFKVN